MDHESPLPAEGILELCNNQHERCLHEGIYDNCRVDGGDTVVPRSSTRALMERFMIVVSIIRIKRAMVTMRGLPSG